MLETKKDLNKDDKGDSNDVKFENFTMSDISILSSNENNNYIKDTFFKNIIINILIILFSISIIISEYYFREPLFEYSKSFEKNWQENASNFTLIFFKIITKVGGEYLMGAPVAFVLCFCSFIKSSFYIAGLIFCLHFHSMMKIWYGSKRPFWENVELYKDICDGGFGNPSGHSITSVYLYLTLFVYISQSKLLRKKIIPKIILFILFVTYIILIILSRLILGVHSVNQVIYGSSLGLIVTLLIVQVFKLHQMPIQFYKNLFKERTYIFCISSMLGLLEILSILSCLTFNKSFDYKKYEKILSDTCGSSLPNYRKFNLDGLFGSFVVLSLLGMYLGQIIFWHLIDNSYKNNSNKNINQNIDFNKTESEDISSIIKDGCDEKNYSKIIDKYIIYWNKNRDFLFGSMWNVIKIIIIINICFSPVILFMGISKEANIVLIFIFKFGIPFFLIFFLLYSFGFYYIIKIACGTKEDLLKKASKNMYDNNNIV